MQLLSSWFSIHLQVVKAIFAGPKDPARDDVAVACGLDLLHLVMIHQIVEHSEQPAGVPKGDMMPGESRPGLGMHGILQHDIGCMFM